MRRFAFLVALGLAAPAGAQIVGPHDYGDVRMPERLGPSGRMRSPSPGREARDIRRDIERLRDSGAISRREARQLSRQARLIARHGHGSLSDSAVRALEAQALALRSQVYAAAARADGRR